VSIRHIIDVKKYTKFRIDVTFEMRTILCGICLFIDNAKSSDSIFISNGDGGEENRIGERQV